MPPKQACTARFGSKEVRVLRADDVALRMLDPVKVRIGIDDARIHPKLKLTIVEPRLPTL